MAPPARAAGVRGEVQPGGDRRHVAQEPEDDHDSRARVSPGRRRGHSRVASRSIDGSILSVGSVDFGHHSNFPSGAAEHLSAF